MKNTMKLIEELKAYEPFNEQEERDKAIILECLENNDRIFTRNSVTAHMTASAWVVNKSRDKVLMAYHNIYDSWAWLGGHADGERDLLSVAIKETMEESGIRNVTPVTEKIYSIEVLTVDGHMKRGEYVSSHLHLNITYLLQADETELLTVKADENSGVSWFALEEVFQKSSEPWFCENVYSKLNKKLKQTYNKRQSYEIK